MIKLSGLAAIGVIALVTAILRFLPFWIFHGNKKTPAFVEYLGQVLPYATIGMLVVFCLKNVSFVSGSHGIPEFVSIALIVLVHAWKKNTILSILLGTVCYVILVNFVI